MGSAFCRSSGFLDSRGCFPPVQTGRLACGVVDLLSSLRCGAQSYLLLFCYYHNFYEDLIKMPWSEIVPKGFPPLPRGMWAQMKLIKPIEIARASPFSCTLIPVNVNCPKTWVDGRDLCLLALGGHGRFYEKLAVNSLQAICPRKRWSLVTQRLHFITPHEGYWAQLATFSSDSRPAWSQICIQVGCSAGCFTRHISRPEIVLMFYATSKK